MMRITGHVTLSRHPSGPCPGEQTSESTDEFTEAREMELPAHLGSPLPSSTALQYFPKDWPEFYLLVPKCFPCISSQEVGGMGKSRPEVLCFLFSTLRNVSGTQYLILHSVTPQSLTEFTRRNNPSLCPQ